jgi:hypothetical protein
MWPICLLIVFSVLTFNSSLTLIITYHRITDNVNLNNLCYCRIQISTLKKSKLKKVNSFSDAMHIYIFDYPEWGGHKSLYGIFSMELQQS